MCASGTPSSWRWLRRSSCRCWRWCRAPAETGETRAASPLVLISASQLAGLSMCRTLLPMQGCYRCVRCRSRAANQRFALPSLDVQVCAPPGADLAPLLPARAHLRAGHNEPAPHANLKGKRSLCCRAIRCPPACCLPGRLPAAVVPACVLPSCVCIDAWHSCCCCGCVCMCACALAGLFFLVA